MRFKISKLHAFALGAWVGAAAPAAVTLTYVGNGGRDIGTLLRLDGDATFALCALPIAVFIDERRKRKLRRMAPRRDVLPGPGA